MNSVPYNAHHRKSSTRPRISRPTPEAMASTFRQAVVPSNIQLFMDSTLNQSFLPQLAGRTPNIKGSILNSFSNQLPALRLHSVSDKSITIQLAVILNMDALKLQPVKTACFGGRTMFKH